MAIKPGGRRRYQVPVVAAPPLERCVAERPSGSSVSGTICVPGMTRAYGFREVTNGIPAKLCAILTTDQNRRMIEKIPGCRNRERDRSCRPGIALRESKIPAPSDQSVATEGRSKTTPAAGKAQIFGQETDGLRRRRTVITVARPPASSAHVVGSGTAVKRISFKPVIVFAVIVADSKVELM